MPHGKVVGPPIISPTELSAPFVKEVMAQFPKNGKAFAQVDDTNGISFPPIILICLHSQTT